MSSLIRSRLLTATLLLISSYLHAQTINPFAGNHTAGYTGNGMAATTATCYAPAGVAADTNGNIYFCEIGNSVVRKVNATGIISTVAGTGVQGFSGNGGPATAAQINQPTSVAIDDTGNIYFTDDGNNMIRKVNTAGIITTIAGTGTAGYFGDNGFAVNAELSQPSGVAIDRKGNIYIADVYNHAVRMIDTSGKIKTIAGDGTPGYSGNGTSAVIAQLKYPKGVAVDTFGNIFIVDQGNSTIRRINPAGIIIAFAGCDTAGYSGDGDYGYNAKLSGPTEVTIDKAGNVYIADFGNHVIRKVKPSGFISTYAGNGSSGYSGDGGNALSAQMAGPYGVAADKNGKLYITDEINNVVRVIDMTTGINELNNNTAGLKLYPNPSDGKLTVEIPAIMSATDLMIVDITGRTIQARSIMPNDKTTTINISNLATGTYFMKMNTANTIYREKFIVW